MYTKSLSAELLLVESLTLKLFFQTLFTPCTSFACFALYILFILSAYVTPFHLAVSPLLFRCSDLPASPRSSFLRPCWPSAVAKCLCVCGFVVWWLYLQSALSLSLLTFSVSRIPFREDPPPDIIPSPWAGRSVASHREKNKSCSAAESSETEKFPQVSNLSFKFDITGLFLWWE